MITHPKLRWVFWLAAVTAAMVASPVRAIDPSRDLQFTSADQRERWQKGSDQVLSGDFQSGARTLERLREDAPNAEGLRDVLQWVDEINDLASSRERLRDKIFNYHRERALKNEREARERESKGLPLAREESSASDDDQPPAAADKSDKTAKGDKKDKPDKLGTWKEAMGEVYATLQNASDEKAFRELDWVKRISADAARTAAKLRDQRNWREAYVIFELLRLTYPDDDTYKRESRDCRQHAHFEAFYTPKNEWKRELKDIDPSVVREILARASQDYVRELDFKKLTISGLENIQLLAKTTKLDKVFPSLGDKDLVGNFVDRIGQQIGKVRSRRRFDYKESAAVFEQIRRINRETIALPDSVLIDEYISGVLEPLDDFTSVIWPSDVAEFTKHTRGEFVGIGIQIQKDLATNFIRVESPLEDTPAYEAGVAPGDLITSVDGKSTTEISVTDAVDLITGEPGSKVTLGIREPNGNERTLTLTRRKVQIRTIFGVSRTNGGTGWDYMLDRDRKIGYVRINSFMEQTVEELKLALEKLQREGCKGLILDLRFNPGGLLKAATDVSSLFLDEDEPIVMTKGRNGKPDQDITSKGGPGFRNIPLIILVNDASASASEIVSGALSGRGKACIIGSRTFGKGLVQNLIPIEDGSAYLKLTTQYYYVPNADKEMPWRCLHREEGAKIWGVDPDIMVKVTPFEARKIIKLRRKADVLRGKGRAEIARDSDRKPTTQPDDDDEDSLARADEHPDTDPQLMTALSIMRMKLLSNQPFASAPKVAIRDPLIEEVPAER